MQREQYFPKSQYSITIKLQNGKIKKPKVMLVHMRQKLLVLWEVKADKKAQKFIEVCMLNMIRKY